MANYSAQTYTGKWEGSLFHKRHKEIEIVAAANKILIQLQI